MNIFNLEYRLAVKVNQIPALAEFDFFASDPAAQK